MTLMHDALVYRIERLKEATVNNAPILYKSGAFKYKLDDHEDVMALFKNKELRFPWDTSDYMKLLQSFMVPIGNIMMKPKHLQLKY